ncbi:uncharacterized protein Aud_001974 [Aspergillus udagawae]|uniref:Secreted protein CSS2 C-terminal domain-containing protein n=1 Tax=Aspergillus udagawae TaxID=91492 RepID=A0A8E0V5A3_9EURO|nr:uncharacterized protein Aud_001974 [Aspergillus udagawae]GIC94645.1 hypothetical protein Aud_001974 [Aspergillus udagawae]
MLLMKTAVSAIALSLPTLAHGSPSPTSINGQPLPDRWHQIDLIDASGVEYPEYAQSLVMGLTGNFTEVDLQKRRPDDVCRYIITANACLGIGSYVVGWAKSMAQIIKDLSNNHDCGVIDGTYRDIRYVFYASGRNCDTTSQQDTIAAAINKYMQKVDNGNLCHTECLRITHGGTYSGWLKVGPKNSFKENAYCGTHLNFDHCISGGNNDI